jgi:hypothetical protein
VKLFNQVHCDKYNRRANGLPGSSTYPLAQRTTGTPGAVTAEGLYFKIPIAATSEAEANGVYQLDLGPYRCCDILQVTFAAAFSASSTHVEAVFGLVPTANDAKASMNGILWVVAADGTVTLQAKDGSTKSQLAVATGVTLSTTPKEFNLDFRTGVVVADPRASGSYGGYRAIQASASDGNGLLQPVARSTILDLLALETTRLQLIAQIIKSSSTDTGYLKFAAEVEYRWQSPSS